MKAQKSAQLSINDFKIRKELGAGSFGKVRLVTRKTDNKEFAIKSILLSKVSQKQKDAALNQIRLLASISIPNVIEYHGSFYHSQQQSLCIVMQYADGRDLQYKIKQQKNANSKCGMDQKFIWKVAYQVLLGLKKLHQNNIIHRDIKCANIFFVKGIAKLGDLNISKVTDNGFCSTQTGTPYYTSPEIWKGETYNGKCDIWSLGCIIYEMAMLSPPFKASDFPSLYRSVLEGKYNQLPNSYSSDLKMFIKLCLTVDASRRPSAEELLSTTILSGMELCMEKFDQKNQGQINMIDPIQCPKVLRFLNSKLPQREDKKKKTVKIAVEEQDEEKETSDGLKFKSRKIRSQKVIKMPCQQPSTLKNVQIGSRKNIKLPPLQPQKKLVNQTSTKALQFSKSTSKSLFKIKKNQTAKSMKCIGGKQNCEPIF